MMIKLATANLSKTKSEKHSLEPKEVKKKSLRLQKFRINFDFIRLSKVKRDADKKTRYAKNIDKRKKPN